MGLDKRVARATPSLHCKLGRGMEIPGEEEDGNAEPHVLDGVEESQAHRLGRHVRAQVVEDREHDLRRGA